MTKNPFEKLRIKDDYEEEEDDFITVGLKKKHPAIQTVPEETKKKKKIRPEEKKRLEDEINKNQDQQQNLQGFTEVRKQKRPYQKEGDINYLIENALKQGEAKIFPQNKFEPRYPRGGKRLFERHSGTGRGREISKQGAGGKTTWGNPEQLAHNEIYEEEYNHNDEDYYFVFAATDSLKEKEKETEKVEHEEDLKHEVQEDKKEEYMPKKKRKGIYQEEEKKKEPVVEVPDNSVSYQEYKERKKELKQEDIKKMEKNVIQNIEGPQIDLKPKVKNIEEIQISLSEKTTEKKKNKQKDKKTNMLEDKINRIIGQNIIEKKEEYGTRYYGKKAKYNYEKEYQNQGFTFSKDAFPELK
jgi:hypothetical protein